VHDFYDDHPYGNNHTWVPTLQRLREHIDQHGAKPLILGEAIAADTWVDPEPLLKKVGDARPYWLPGFLDGNRRWLERMSALYGPTRLSVLDWNSLAYAHWMRKYQIEAFRREMPHGGYVVSVLRDFPLAGMGLLGYDNEPKLATKIWAWHGETMCLLRTENDRRSFWADEKLSAKVLVSHVGTRPLENAEMTVTT